MIIGRSTRRAVVWAGRWIALTGSSGAGKWLAGGARTFAAAELQVEIRRMRRRPGRREYNLMRSLVPTADATRTENRKQRERERERERALRLHSNNTHTHTHRERERERERDIISSMRGGGALLASLFLLPCNADASGAVERTGFGFVARSGGCGGEDGHGHVLQHATQEGGRIVGGVRGYQRVEGILQSCLDSPHTEHAMANIPLYMCLI